MILLLGQHENKLLNAVNKTLLGRSRVCWADHSSLVHELEIDDEISREGQAKVRWSLQGNSITPDIISGVLNELYYLPTKIFDSYHPEDRDYAAAEHTAYLIFALNVFRNVLSKPSCGTLSGFSRSLLYQWHHVQDIHVDVNIPLFFFGPLALAPAELMNSPNRILSKDIYNTKNWISTRINQYSESECILIYERPLGVPIFVTMVGTRSWCHGFGISISYPDIVSRLIHIASTLSNQLDLQLSTTLFFFKPEKDLISFASISSSVDLDCLDNASRHEVIEDICSILIS